MNLEEVMQEFERYMIRENYRRKTIYQYLRAIRKNFQHENLERLTQDDLNAIKLDLMQTYQVIRQEVCYLMLKIRRFQKITTICSGITAPKGWV